MTSRRPTGFPTPTGNPAQHKDMLSRITETLDIAQRVRGDHMKSFVRLEELVALGLADQYGKLLTPSSGAASDSDQLHAFFQGE